MLRTLSNFNLVCTVCYFLGYLQNGSRIVILGLLTAIVYNWLVLRNMERGQSRIHFLQWLLAALTLSFALYIGYSALFLLLAAIEYRYFPWKDITLIASSGITMLALIFHLFLSIRESLVKKDE
ncbi:hypothetical protein [Pedobacter hartonius]|uniref:Uncharacterized protein n=1 Tax=Pedobacter hartonius TaxID=425514 RepID=A0A1H3ZU56_9SPHI|nr:hypothetical protein [Pedobacter hartonius]SEA27165.1 hypothetical protein SAMN05443550_102491 [Pedobacter hartonius]